LVQDVGLVVGDEFQKRDLRRAGLDFFVGLHDKTIYAATPEGNPTPAAREDVATRAPLILTRKGSRNYFDRCWIAEQRYKNVESVQWL
jgi:hypothetical protein